MLASFSCLMTDIVRTFSLFSITKRPRNMRSRSSCSLQVARWRLYQLESSKCNWFTEFQRERWTSAGPQDWISPELEFMRTAYNQDHISCPLMDSSNVQPKPWSLFLSLVCLVFFTKLLNVKRPAISLCLKILGKTATLFYTESSSLKVNRQ